jgi:hypothetical protein
MKMSAAELAARERLLAQQAERLDDHGQSCMLAASVLRVLVARVRAGDQAAEEMLTCASEEIARGIAPDAFTGEIASRSPLSSAADRILRSSTRSARRSPK